MHSGFVIFHHGADGWVAEAIGNFQADTLIGFGHRLLQGMQIGPRLHGQRRHGVGVVRGCTLIERATNRRHGPIHAHGAAQVIPRSHQEGPARSALGARLNQIGPGEHLVGRPELALFRKLLDVANRLLLQLDRRVQETDLLQTVNIRIECADGLDPDGQLLSRDFPLRT